MSPYQIIGFASYKPATCFDNDKGRDFIVRTTPYYFQYKSILPNRDITLHAFLKEIRKTWTSNGLIKFFNWSKCIVCIIILVKPTTRGNYLELWMYFLCWSSLLFVSSSLASVSTQAGTCTHHNCRLVAKMRWRRRTATSAQAAETGRWLYCASHSLWRF